MTTMLDKLFSAPSGSLFFWFSTHGRRRQALIDVRELPPYVQRDIGLLDGQEEIARRLGKGTTERPVTAPAALSPCVRR